MGSALPYPGKVFLIDFPFVRDTYQGFDGEGYAELPTWKPGVRFENVGPEDYGAVADAIGKAIFTVVDTFKPGRFPTRVFYTRQFITPDGHVFGKGALRIATLAKFRRLVEGYWHPYGVGEPLAQWSIRESRETFERLLAEHGA